MGEPALAALIQEDIGASLGQPPIGRRGTFSFDLLNGACGVISAAQIESGLLRSGVIRLGVIVTGDVSPNLENPRATLVQPTGGAMILGWDDRLAGFTDFPSRRFPNTRNYSSAGWCGRTDMGTAPSAE
jgi:3-oxoacyl-[acyl-carrier-protein] synthase III